MAKTLFPSTPSQLAPQDTPCARAEGHAFHLTYYIIRDRKARMQCSYCKATYLRNMNDSERLQYFKDERLMADPTKAW